MATHRAFPSVVRWDGQHLSNTASDDGSFGDYHLEAMFPVATR